MQREPKRIRLAHLPTPLESLQRWRPNLWVKRDDMSGSELAGNKVRKLEYLAAEALELGADMLVTVGDVQSNHARATAAVAARLGLDCLLLLEGEADPAEWQRGNAVIDRCFGATIDWLPADESLSTRLEQAGQRLRGQGRRPYLIPVGGSTELGVWGYIAAAREAKEQSEQLGLRIDRLVCPVGSCGTLVGLLLGAKLADWPVRVMGMGISGTLEKKRAWSRRLAERTIDRFGLPVQLADDDFALFDYSGAGYARSRPEELELIVHVARRTGLLLDPVYTAKAFFGLEELLASGTVGPDEQVLFFHTGGLLGLMAKVHQLPLPPAPQA